MGLPTPVDAATQLIQQLFQSMGGTHNPPVGGVNSQGQTIVGRTANNPSQGIDLGGVIQALIGGPRQQQQDLLFNFGHTSKPMLRQNIGGQYEGDPNALPTGLDAFYAANAGRAGRDATGAPLQGDAAFADRIGPLAEVSTNYLKNRTSSGIDATNRGFSGGGAKYGTSGNDANVVGAPLGLMPQVDPLAIGQDVWSELSQKGPNAFGKATKKKRSSDIWTSFLPYSHGSSLK